jgi:hypothetical protein
MSMDVVSNGVLRPIFKTFIIKCTKGTFQFQKTVQPSKHNSISECGFRISDFIKICKSMHCKIHPLKLKRYITLTDSLR